LVLPDRELRAQLGKHCMPILLRHQVALVSC
jgi:hypothetical protein